MSKKVPTQGVTLFVDSCLIIGDVHGCYDELISMIDLHGKDRDIIFVGDLVDKGPRSHRCLELAKLLGTAVVMGNHEENHIRYAAHEVKRIATGKKNPMKRDDAFIRCHDKIQNSSLDLISYMQSFPHFLRVGDGLHHVIVLHGGLLPGHTPETMDAKRIVRVRNVHHDGSFATLDECEADPTLPFWTEKYTGEDWVAFGHAPFLQTKMQNRTFALDTGCVYGNRLTALRLPEMDTVHVDAFATYDHKDKWDV